jgi:hypothetical protein
MAYKPPPAADGSPRPVLPCVRLGAMMEGAYPSRTRVAQRSVLALFWIVKRNHWIMIYPLVNIQKTIENGHRNSGFSH